MPRDAHQRLIILSECQDLIIHARDETALLQAVCGVLVGLGGWRMAWVAYAEDDAARTVRPVCHAGHEDGFFEQARMSWGDIPEGHGPTGRAIREARPVVVADIATDPACEPFRTLAVSRGYRAAVSIPLRAPHAPRTLGALVMYSEDPAGFDDSECTLLTKLADNLAFGIMAIRGHTERVQSEATRELQTKALDAAHNSILITDADGRIVWANTSLCTTTGYTLEELIGQNPRMLKSGRHPPEFYQELWRTILSGTAWRGLIHNRRRDGSHVSEETTITPVLNEQNQVTHFVAIKQDITEWLKTEAALLRAQRMESIGLLAGGIAHDLNNILAPVIIMADLLRSEALTPTGREMVDGIWNSARRGAQIVKQVLTFARGVGGERLPVQLQPIVTDMVGVALETFPKNIRIEHRMPKDLWTIRGDHTQVHQVLMNLCLNARDAMPDGGLLRIEARNLSLTDNQAAEFGRSARAGDFVTLTVADSGIGMLPQVLEHIFDPFFTTKEHGKGTGLGLSTAMGIVRDHDGWLNVASTYGAGSVFEVYLPAESSGASLVDDRFEGPPPPPGKGEVILLVDDEAAIRDSIGRLLRQQGFKPLLAEDGLAGLRLYREHRHAVRLILTDVMMPNLAGDEMCIAIRRADPTIPIIVSSGGDQEGWTSGRLSKLGSAGSTEFLAKPYDGAKLLNAIGQLLHSPPG